MRDDNEGGTPGTWRTYTPPPGLELPDEQPFWVAVAWWGWKLKRPFSYQEVATAFRVPPGVARNVMNYIVALPAEVLLCTRHYVPGRGKVRHRLLAVTSPPSLVAPIRCRQLAARRRSAVGREMVDAVIAALRARGVATDNDEAGLPGGAVHPGKSTDGDGE